MLLLIFLIGSCFGSFYTLLADRFGRHNFSLHSQCQSCYRKLTLVHLVPVFSYLIQGGRCQFCQTKIPTHVFISELITGLYFAYFIIFKPGTWLEIMLILGLLSFLQISALIDFRTLMVPDRLQIIILTFICLYSYHYSLIPWKDRFITSIAVFSLLSVFNLLIKDGLGGADIKVFASLSLGLGFEVTNWLILISASLALLIFSFHKSTIFKVREVALPFFPAIFIASILVFAWI